jgi:Protein of unknown function (DUF4231)
MMAAPQPPAPPREPVADPAAADPVWERLEDQIVWYDRKSRENQRWYRRLKLLELVIAASLPVLTGLNGLIWIIGVLSATIVVLEGTQHLFQFHEQWIAYRSTCETLRHERYLYRARAAHYADAIDSRALLAERIERLTSDEIVRWASLYRQEPRGGAVAAESSAGAT